jgi:hypothetical protein
MEADPKGFRRSRDIDQEDRPCDGSRNWTGCAASWHLIERPLLQLKDRIPYRRDADAAGYEGTPPFASRPATTSALSLGRAN